MEDMVSGTFTGTDEVVLRLWNEVVKTVNRILEADRKFGFSKIEASLNPSLAEIVHGLGLIDFVLTSFVDSSLLDHEEIRQSLNAKQCVLHIRRLAVALQENDKDEYDKVISLLNSQPKF